MERDDFANELISLEDSLEQFAYSLTPNMEGAKDFVQEFLPIWNNLRTIPIFPM